MTHSYIYIPIPECGNLSTQWETLPEFSSAHRSGNCANVSIQPDAGTDSSEAYPRNMSSSGMLLLKFVGVYKRFHVVWFRSRPY